MRRVHVLISGRVQGVFYRASCAERAHALGLSGWIRNLPDGRVEAEFEGKGPSVSSILDWCRQGPSMAVVDGVEDEERPLEGGSGFHLRG